MAGMTTPPLAKVAARPTPADSGRVASPTAALRGLRFRRPAPPPADRLDEDTEALYRELDGEGGCFATVRSLALAWGGLALMPRRLARYSSPRKEVLHPHRGLAMAGEDALGLLQGEGVGDLLGGPSGGHLQPGGGGVFAIGVQAALVVDLAELGGDEAGDDVGHGDAVRLHLHAQGVAEGAHRELRDGVGSAPGRVSR